jgi:hypothetical protein
VAVVAVSEGVDVDKQQCQLWSAALSAPPDRAVAFREVVDDDMGAVPDEMVNVVVSLGDCAAEKVFQERHPIRPRNPPASATSCVTAATSPCGPGSAR